MTREERRVVFWIGFGLSGVAGAILLSAIGAMLHPSYGALLGLGVWVTILGLGLMVFSFRAPGTQSYRRE